MKMLDLYYASLCLLCKTQENQSKNINKKIYIYVYENLTLLVNPALQDFTIKYKKLQPLRNIRLHLRNYS